MLLRFCRHFPMLLYRRAHRPRASNACTVDRWSSSLDHKCKGKYYTLIGCIDRLVRRITCFHIEDLTKEKINICSVTTGVLENCKRIALFKEARHGGLIGLNDFHTEYSWTREGWRKACCLAFQRRWWLVKTCVKENGCVRSNCLSKRSSIKRWRCS